MNFSRITVTAIEDFHAESDNSIADLEECFFFFLQEFGPIASGYNSYNERKRQLTCFQDSCTPSDEALVIFFLEINWENWIDQVDNETQGKKGNKCLPRSFLDGRQMMSKNSMIFATWYLPHVKTVKI